MALEVRQNERFQQRERLLERIGWTIMTVIVLAGLVGLLGNGPISWTTSESDAGLVAVEYQRITHHEADDSITLTFSPDAVENGTITLTMTGSWVAGVDRQGVTPQPSDESVVPVGTVMEIPVETAGESQLRVTFRAQEYGTLSGAVAVKNDQTSFTQLVLP